jgi:hypothetical protein
MPAKKTAKKAKGVTSGAKGKKTVKKPAKSTAKKKSETGGSVMSPGVLVVNMIPRSRSGEHNQDSEPNLAVDPAAPLNMVGSAFTPDPGGGPNAPIYFSTDGGNTWKLNSIVPGNGTFGTGDITVRFSPSHTLYAGILRGDVSLRMNILRTANFTSSTPMTVLLSRDNVDQPYIQAARVTIGAVKKDVVFNGDNDFNAVPKTATINHTTDAQVAAPVFKTTRIDSRIPSGVDAPSIRPAIHSNGTVYGVFLHRVSASGSVRRYDVVVVRDDKFGTSAAPFTALKDPSDGLPGRRVVLNRLIPWLMPGLGQERTGSSLTIAVDPTNSKTVYIAWADRVGTTDYTLHVRVSKDSGVTWSGDCLTVTNATNPALAVNSVGKIGFLYQQLRGTTTALTQRWVTRLRRSTDGISWDDLVLANTAASTPVRTFFPYIGDYNHLLTVGKDFYGIFSASNFPDAANFPNGVKYQRNANFTTHKLFNIDGATEVPISIDPFYFKVTE